MIAPGTPALDLPPFVAPSFTAAAVPASDVGTVVTSVTIEGNGKTPFAFAQAFVESDLAPGKTLAGRLADGKLVYLQVEHKATHNDGSVRHAYIAGILADLGGSAVVDLVRVTPGPMGDPVAADPVIYRMEIVHDGVVYTARSGGAGIPVRRGRLVNETVYDVAPTSPEGVKHNVLTSRFGVQYFPSTGTSKVRFTCEASDPFSTNGFIPGVATETNKNPAPIPAKVDIAYEVRLFAGDTPIYNHNVVIPLHTPGGHWTETFEFGTKRGHVKHDPAYLVATRQIPAYDSRVKVSEATLAGYAAMLAKYDFGPMGFGYFAPVMQQPGGRNDIGMAPDCHAATAHTADKRAYDLMIAVADMGGSWGVHWRDRSAGPVSGYPLDTVHWPMATVIPTDGMNKLTGKSERIPHIKTASRGQPDVSHHPAFAYLPYLLTGDPFYLDELHFWLSYSLLATNPAYRGFHKGWVKSHQVRGQAWSLRDLAEAAYLTPDNHPAKASYLYQLDCNMDYYHGRYVAKTIRADGTPMPASPTLADQVSDIGIICDGYSQNYKFPALDGRKNPDGTPLLVEAGFGPWQDSFFTSEVGRAAHLGNAKARALMQWKGKFVVSTMIGEGIEPMSAPIYQLRSRNDALSPYYPTTRMCYSMTLGAEANAAPGSPERLAMMNARRAASKPTSLPPLVPGEMEGYASEPTGFGANMQPALAAACDWGVPGAMDAWRVYEDRVKKQNYSIAMQFAIVPYVPSLVVSPPAQPSVPPPPPIPTPTPTPTPAPVPVTPPVVTPTPIPPPVIPPVPPAPVGATVALFNERLAGGQEYVVTVTAANGQILAVQFPVVATSTAAK